MIIKTVVEFSDTEMEVIEQFINIAEDLFQMHPDIDSWERAAEYICDRFGY